MKRILQKLFVAGLIAGGIWTYFQFVAKAKPPVFALPPQVVWRHTTRGGDSQAPSFAEVVAVEQPKWRVETLGKLRQILVEVCDGARIRAGAGLPSPETMDPINHLQSVYTEVADAKPKGIGYINGSLCWHFAEKQNGSTYDAWFGCVPPHLIRRLLVTNLDGTKIQDDYEVLGTSVDSNQAFDARNTAALFGSELRAVTSFSSP